MLAVNAPGTCQIESANQKSGRIFASDNATNPEELLRYIRYYKEYYGKPVEISDVTMANGCDNAFMNRAMQEYSRKYERRCHCSSGNCGILSGMDRFSGIKKESGYISTAGFDSRLAMPGECSAAVFRRICAGASD